MGVQLLPVAEAIGDLGHSGWGTRFSVILIFLHFIKLFRVPIDNALVKGL
jgi:hypothetical protein